jgi:hypothetical protein
MGEPRIGIELARVLRYTLNSDGSWARADDTGGSRSSATRAAVRTIDSITPEADWT